MNKIELFRYVNKYLIQEYYGKDSTLTDDDIKDRFISPQGWLMFPDRNITSIKEGKSADIPNVYLWADQDPVLWANPGEVVQFGSDSKLEPELVFGITFNNMRNVDRLLTIIEPANMLQRQNFEKCMHRLSDSYMYYINIKTNFSHPQRVPEFDKYYADKTNEIDLFEVCNMISIHRPVVKQDVGKVETRGKVCRRTLSFDPVTCKTTNWEDFGDHFTIVFDAFKQLLALHTGKNLKNENVQIELDREKVAIIDRQLKFDKTLSPTRRKDLESRRQSIVAELQAKGIKIK